MLSDRLSCVAVDSWGAYCAGGTNQGRVYLWEVGLNLLFGATTPTSINQVSSGILFNAWDAHYRQINVLRFTPDGAALISGSDDSAVSVWSIARYNCCGHGNKTRPHRSLIGSLTMTSKMNLRPRIAHSRTTLYPSRTLCAPLASFRRTGY